ncbi:MAG: DUF4838 domain-containing protein [Pirellulaceae bacterium]
MRRCRSLAQWILVRRRIAWTILCFVLYSQSSMSRAMAPTIELANVHRAMLPVVVGTEASAATKAAAADLAHYLGRMSGAEFTIETGDGSRGIVVGRPADFSLLPISVQFRSGPFDREEYVLRSHAQGLYLLGASDLAVSHAVWDLLYRLGYRQFFPGQTWEVVPNVSHLKINLDDRQSPSFSSRRIWYNWGLWGYNDEPYRQWCQRNRAVKGFDLHSGHSYEAIVAANRGEFDRHPEYFALVGDQRKCHGGDLKFCISNPDLRKLVVAHAVRFFQGNPADDSISMDPSDGGGWCECDACARLGSVSDRVVMLANEVAQTVNGSGIQAKYVGIYAYNEHSAPPHIAVHPNVIPSATTAFIRGGYTFDQIVEGWQAKGATLGVYDYLSVVDWDWNLPRGGAASRPSYLAEFLPRIHQQGIRFYDAESGDCWGPCGLGYYVASRILWDVTEAQRLEVLVEDFLDKAFGSAKEPMREFYRLITTDTQRRSPADLVGRMYRQLDAARRATADPQVQERINHLILYTRHAELYYAYANHGGSVEDVARHAYRIRKTMMVHSYGLWCRLISQEAALTPNHPLQSEQPLGPEEITTILAEGIAKNQPTDPGFVGVEFSRRLVPALQHLRLPQVPPGTFPAEPQDHQQYWIWIPDGTDVLDLKIRVQKVWANRMPKINLYSPMAVTLNPVASDESYKPDGTEYHVRLNTPEAGLHRVETFDGGDFTRIQWPAGMPVTIESGIDTPDVTSHFRGSWTMYFYVPKRTQFVAGWASRVANWAPRISGKLLDAEGREVLDFGKSEEGWFRVPVPEGQDGRLWKFENSHGQRLLMTVPPYLARSAEELLVPQEIAEADAK